MKNPVFTGAGVAIITPMYEDGSINFDELGRIIEDQIARSTDAIVICGTTGECSTMTDEEQLAAIKYTVDVVNHRVPVIAGAGSNDTDHGCALAAKSAACGADALLMVTPYYNKTSQAGLVAHFTAMAEAGGIPVIVYNVPSRTGLNIAPETALELSKHPLINGIKEASGNISQVAKIAALCGDELNIYSGNDDQVVPLMSLGGLGVIANDFHPRRDLSPNLCAVYVEEDARCQGIAGALLGLACRDMAQLGYPTLYLLTDHTAFYERYGWEYLCPVRGDGEEQDSRMYIHRQTEK